MSMIDLRGRTTGVDEMTSELAEEVLANAEKSVGEGARVLGREMKRLLGKRRGPSAPGQPPAREEDWLWRCVGWTRAKRYGDKVQAKVGIGFGRGYSALQAALAQGVNPFEYAWTHEYGGISGKNRTTRLPPRPFARPAEVRVESEVVRILTIH